MNTFDTVIAFILQEEGGYSNDPNDPGGETNYGIAKRFHPDVDIKNLTREQAIEIYRAEYWAPIRGDELPPSIAFVTMDAAVNEGVAFAQWALQTALGVKVDRIIGPVTLAAAKAANRILFVLEFTARRAVAYGESQQFHYNGLGWARRYLAAMLRALAL